MGVKVINVNEDILGANENQAELNRKLLDGNNILMVNIMSSPGAGKTTLILKMNEELKGRGRAGVIEGDVASTVDADKMNERDIPVVQINTAGGCHLDANMVDGALKNLPLGEIDILFIENVGNLICPAGFNLGEQRRVMLLSVPEGHDKPYKYPTMFTTADAVIVTKMDLAPLLDFDFDAFDAEVTALNKRAKIFKVSAKTGEGIPDLVDWFLAQK